MGRTVRKDGSSQVLRPIVIAEQITITGGCCNKKLVLDTELLSWEGDSLSSVVVGKQESWLCQLVCGNGVWHRPLQRCQIFHVLSTAVCDSAVSDTAVTLQDDSKMALLSFDDEEPATVTPTKRARVRGGRSDSSPGKTPVVTGTAVGETITRVVQMPTLPDVATKTSVYVAWHKKKTWLACRSLPWLIAYLHREKEMGGVPAVAAPAEECRHLIKWDFRDDLWVARVKSPDGRLYRRRGGYRRRQKVEGDACYGLCDREAKQIVFDELQEWVATVQSGRASDADLVHLHEA